MYAMAAGRGEQRHRRNRGLPHVALDPGGTPRHGQPNAEERADRRNKAWRSCLWGWEGLVSLVKGLRARRLAGLNPA